MLGYTVPTPYSDPLAHAALEEKRSLVRNAFGRMSEKQGIVVKLHDMEGYTIQEIAKIIRCPAGTVKSRLFYGRQEFKAVFNALLSNGCKASSAAMN